MSDLPVACSLMPAELQERGRDVLSRIRISMSAVTELPNGFVYHFPSEGRWILELANVIQLERQCCPFLTFRLTVEPGNADVLLEMTGPDGTKEFLADLFANLNA